MTDFELQLHLPGSNELMLKQAPDVFIEGPTLECIFWDSATILFNTLRPTQNGCQLADNTFKNYFVECNLLHFDSNFPAIFSQQSN